jgi:hypothetical protein
MRDKFAFLFSMCSIDGNELSILHPELHLVAVGAEFRGIHGQRFDRVDSTLGFQPLKELPIWAQTLGDWQIDEALTCPLPIFGAFQLVG